MMRTWSSSFLENEVALERGKMLNTHRYFRLVPAMATLALAAVGNAQISNVTSDIGYNNQEEGYDSTNTFFGNEHQFLVLPNPPTSTLTSPLADYVFTNPSNNGSAELKASSSTTTSFTST